MRRDSRIELRVSSEEKLMLLEAAGGQRELSKFIRDAALAKAQGDEYSGEMKLVDNRPPVPQVKIATVTACPRQHHHRTGVYCGSCGKVIK